MDSFRFHDIRVEKANSIVKNRRIRRLTALFRCMELFVFLIVLSRFSAQFSFSFKLSTEYFRRISVFVVGNAIVIVLFMISGQFSGKEGAKSTDLYEEYVGKCRNNNQRTWSGEEKRASDVNYESKVLSSSHSAKLERTVNGLRRSVSEKCRKSVDYERKAAAPYAEDEMSSDEFRRTVEAFIARQQRFLREEEEVSASNIP